MATMTFTPSAVSPVNAFTFNLKIFLREARYEFVRLSRTRSFAFSVIGFPVAFYLFFGLIMNRGEHIGTLSVAKYMLASYAVFGMVGASLFGIGVALASELSAGWLELKRASPMPPVAYLLAKCTSAMAYGVIIVSILTLMSIGIGHVSLTLLEFASLMGLTMVGVLPFACMGMALALFIPAKLSTGLYQYDLSADEFLRRPLGSYHVPAQIPAALCCPDADLSSRATRPWDLRLRQQRQYLQPLDRASRLLL